MCVCVLNFLISHSFSSETGFTDHALIERDQAQIVEPAQRTSRNRVRIARPVVRFALPKNENQLFHRQQLESLSEIQRKIMKFVELVGVRFRLFDLTRLTRDIVWIKIGFWI